MSLRALLGSRLSTPATLAIRDRRGATLALLMLGALVYGFLVWAAWTWWAERTVWGDIAYHTFWIANDGWFAVQNHRFVAMLSQLPVLWGTAQDWPMERVLRSYSLVFPVLQALAFLWVAGIWRDRAMGLLLLWLHVLAAGQDLFWIQSELPQGLTWLVLAFAYWRRRPSGPLAQAIGVALLLLLAFAHPLLAFPLAVGLWFLAREGEIGRTQAWTNALIYGVLYAVKLVVFRTPYDTGSFGKAAAVLDGIGQTPAWQWFGGALFGPVWGPVLVLLLGLSAYGWMGAIERAGGALARVGARIRRRRKDGFLALGLPVLAFGWVLLVLGSQAEAPAYYLQNLLLPLVVVLGLPAVLHLERWRNPWPWVLALVCTAAILPMKGWALGQLAPAYTAHLQWVRGLAAETQTHPERPTKRFVWEADLPADTLVATWSLPYECLLWSALEGHPPLSVAVAPSLTQLEWARNHTWVFVTQWDSPAHGDLHEGYFHGFDGSSYVDWAP